MREHSWPCRFHISVEIFWAEIYWGRLFIRAESNLIQSSCRSFIRVIVPYERGYETSGSPLRFMLRKSSLVECVSVLPGNRCLQNVEFFFLRQYVQPCLLKNPKYTFYTIKNSLKLAYYIRNSSASINNVTNVNYDIDLQKMYMYSCKMPQMVCLTRWG